MTKVVMDTSSLVTLELIGILEKSFEITEIIIPEIVKAELIEISSYQDKEGKTAKNILNLINGGKIKIIKVKDKKKAHSLLSRNVNEGESECIVCCNENSVKTLVMDDVDAAYELEGFAISNGIKMKISVAVLVELHRNKIINRDELKKYVKKMIKTREWEGGILEVLAKKYLGEL
ncbi:MAG: hypothetical protein COY38_05280 [Candidatus Aenigmarchaeota archaeon CG_4_10_14_0_8_um_filter_37_24]|nr:hypothetical protein [Candidatus Aenigmarchaeota archaeon]OIN88570.1 MAG: hypothetical protein AUJ50_00505 [Candidatus Aenigmarchaeota archaeon CG1_02_38_14]PIV68170.1 MAG: hypothetical protein COS07_04990 [Candidatus Aenigmarchaeota archaeon CG01_land_8_20_14_3_00_37_9]PIW40909.1 MAG: hypothetical protein COW21_04690 [Candidatus Aenigmarchaeota archaeon CG15_BIG_FIL_POST_REV_8_21_14_020_37_27]PIX50431.1 MAG: hypothetical protein COZ52_04175 [Candidatus Aenigmarchaeota archaeon CG_4_8_14_3_u